MAGGGTRGGSREAAQPKIISDPKQADAACREMWLMENFRE